MHRASPEIQFLWSAERRFFVPTVDVGQHTRDMEGMKVMGEHAIMSVCLPFRLDFFAHE